MSRIVNPDSAGKRRNQLMRTAAELLRHLSQKNQIDDEVKDMVATLVFGFREIDEGIEQSTLAWEKRDYWIKAEQFRQRWSWVGLMEAELKAIVYADSWEQLPDMMVKLMPRLADIKVTKFTRKPSVWQGNYRRLMKEKPTAD